MSERVILSVLPPRLSMDDYAEWVSRSSAAVRRDFAERQKRIEERILVRFQFAGTRRADEINPKTQRTK